MSTAKNYYQAKIDTLAAKVKQAEFDAEQYHQQMRSMEQKVRNAEFELQTEKGRSTNLKATLTAAHRYNLQLAQQAGVL